MTDKKYVEPKNDVHQMKIYEEFVNKEKTYQYKNRSEQYQINPFTSIFKK